MLNRLIILLLLICACKKKESKINTPPITTVDTVTQQEQELPVSIDIERAYIDPNPVELIDHQINA